MFTQLDQLVRGDLVTESNRRMLEASQRSQARKAAFGTGPRKQVPEVLQLKPAPRMVLRTAAIMAVTLFALWLGTELAVAASNFFGSGAGRFLVR